MTPADLSTAYARSAYPRLGIPMQRALAEPALRGTLELLHHIHQRTARQANATRAGRYLEATSK